MKLKDETVLVRSIEKSGVSGSFGEPYAVVNFSIGEEYHQAAFSTQIPETYTRLSQIAQAFRDGHDGVEARVSLPGIIKIGKIEDGMTAAQQGQMPMGIFSTLDK